MSLTLARNIAAVFLISKDQEWFCEENVRYESCRWYCSGRLSLHLQCLVEMGVYQVIVLHLFDLSVSRLITIVRKFTTVNLAGGICPNFQRFLSTNLVDHYLKKYLAASAKSILTLQDGSKLTARAWRRLVCFSAIALWEVLRQCVQALQRTRPD